MKRNLAITVVFMLVALIITLIMTSQITTFYYKPMPDLVSCSTVPVVLWQDDTQRLVAIESRDRRVLLWEGDSIEGMAAYSTWPSIGIHTQVDESVPGAPIFRVYTQSHSEMWGGYQIETKSTVNATGGQCWVKQLGEPSLAELIGVHVNHTNLSMLSGFRSMNFSFDQIGHAQEILARVAYCEATR